MGTAAILGRSLDALSKVAFALAVATAVLVPLGCERKEKEKLFEIETPKGRIEIERTKPDEEPATKPDEKTPNEPAAPNRKKVDVDIQINPGKP